MRATARPRPRGRIVAALAAFAIGACAEDRLAAEPSPPLELSVSVRNAAGEAVTACRRREPIIFVVAIRNRSAAPQRFELPSAQTHDVSIATEDGHEVWRWSRGRFFAQVLTPLTLEPGESREFAVTWDEANAPPGAYLATGLIPAPVEVVAPAVRFTLE